MAICRQILAIFFILSMVFCLACACSDGVEKLVIPTLPDKPIEESQALRLRIATFNVHNLFDTICDSGFCGDGDYEKQLSAAQYQKKLGDIVRGIFILDADIVLLQEIEKESALEDLLRNTLGYVGVFGETGRAASVDVAVMVRGKIVDHWLHRNRLRFTDDAGVYRRLARELLEVEIELDDGQSLHVLVTHMISKVTDEPGIRRNGEARAIRGYLDTLAEKHPDRLIVFGGDLNDIPDSVALQSLIGDGQFHLSSADIPEAETYSYRDAFAIDHLIYRNGKNLTYVPASTQRFCNPSPASGFASSDHCAVAADFESSPLP